MCAHLISRINSGATIHMGPGTRERLTGPLLFEVAKRHPSGQQAGGDTSMYTRDA